MILIKNKYRALNNIGICNNFMNATVIAQDIREGIDKWDCMKLKSFCTAKKTVTRLKREPTEWEKIFASYTCDKGLIIRIYREHKH
jgi:hypothetical protein